MGIAWRVGEEVEGVEEVMVMVLEMRMSGVWVRVFCSSLGKFEVAGCLRLEGRSSSRSVWLRGHPS